MPAPNAVPRLAALLCLLAAGVGGSLYADLFGSSASVCTEQSPLGAPCLCPREQSRLHQGADCSDRQIAELPAELELPDGIPSVSFQQNRIAEVKRDQFRYNAAVEVLRLSKNRIAAVGPRAFSNLPGLELLLLDKNGLAEIDATAFEGLTRLARLDLGFNQLRTLEPSLFSGTAIRELQLHYNPLVTLAPDTMLFLPQLQKIDLDSTDLSELPAELFASCPHLITLLVPHNRLTEIPHQTLRRAAGLRHLDLSGNQLQTVPAGAFAECPELRRLVLSSMKTLQRVEGHAFSGLDQLEELLCQFNPALTEVDASAFRHEGSERFLASLQLVDLKENALTQLSAELLPWSSVEFIDLEMNPWTCDCELEWVTGVNHSFKQEPLFKCSEPPTVSGRAIHTLKAEEFVCEDEGANIALIVCLTLLGVGVAAGLIFALWKFNVCETMEKKLTTRPKYGAVPVRSHPDKIEVEGLEWDRNDIGV
ncbi:Carboxypeptidase N subunit 2 [Amphibalanus amphitrite]|uniref:Carboxypeptidase N subunit 2 n=1 Tax=Amphibalanus amphitrite TaxID=1232801 RepID=A0A6A4VRW8_AMPAM|nr:phospholipase A2 inhibitor-like [Amphibalanus amphitrite]KAF0293452.1 Carboxypeptidase N subunit 2 [Amphibalanus amphitrite]